MAYCGGSSSRSHRHGHRGAAGFASVRRTPTATFQPYLGDYVRLLAVETDFYGAFCGNNTPNLANFPNGVSYQRNVNWNTHTLLSTDNVTPVAVSIDPFFFHYSETPVIRIPTPITRAPTPILREPVVRQPVTPEPVTPRPVAADPRPPAQADLGAPGGGHTGADAHAQRHHRLSQHRTAEVVQGIRGEAVVEPALRLPGRDRNRLSADDQPHRGDPAP